MGNTDRALAVGALKSDRVTSHSQQSLQRRHFSQRWLLHASLVQRTQMRVDSSLQMLQKNGMGLVFPSRLGRRLGHEAAASLCFPIHDLELLLPFGGKIDDVALQPITGRAAFRR